MSNDVCVAGSVSFLIDDPRIEQELIPKFSDCKNEILKGSLVKSMKLSTNYGNSGYFQYFVQTLDKDNKKDMFIVYGNVVSTCVIGGLAPIITTDATKNLIFGEYYFNFTIGPITYQFMRRKVSVVCLGAYYFDFLLTAKLNRITTSTKINDKVNMLSKKENEISIFIKSQLLIDFSDIGNTIFELIENNIKTVYEKSCPKIVTVLEGEGLTAWDKLNDIYVRYDINVGSLFVENMMEYSMARFFFTKLLYGKFIMKFLLQKYYKKFLLDLKNSKYNSFYPYFTEGKFKDYYKFFTFE